VEHYKAPKPVEVAWVRDEYGHRVLLDGAREHAWFIDEHDGQFDVVHVRDGPGYDCETLDDAKSQLLKMCGVHRLGEAPATNSVQLQWENLRLSEWVNDLQSGMFINCVYCGHNYGPSDEVPASIVVPPDTVTAKGLATGPDVNIDWTMADVLKAHIEKCPKHPLSQARSRIEWLEECAEEALEFLETEGDVRATISALKRMIREPVLKRIQKFREEEGT
jgi:hypothetical protein